MSRSEYDANRYLAESTRRGRERSAKARIDLSWLVGAVACIAWAVALAEVVQ